jgi:hypothetical protein
MSNGDALLVEMAARYLRDLGLLADAARTKPQTHYWRTVVAGIERQRAEIQAILMNLIHLIQGEDDATDRPVDRDKSRHAPGNGGHDERVNW